MAAIVSHNPSTNLEGERFHALCRLFQCSSSDLFFPHVVQRFLSVSENFQSVAAAVHDLQTVVTDRVWLLTLRGIKEERAKVLVEVTDINASISRAMEMLSEVPENEAAPLAAKAAAHIEYIRAQVPGFDELVGQCRKIFLHAEYEIGMRLEEFFDFVSPNEEWRQAFRSEAIRICDSETPSLPPVFDAPYHALCCIQVWNQANLVLSRNGIEIPTKVLVLDRDPDVALQRNGSIGFRFSAHGLDLLTPWGYLNVITVDMLTEKMTSVRVALAEAFKLKPCKTGAVRDVTSEIVDDPRLTQQYSSVGQFYNILDGSTGGVDDFQDGVWHRKPDLPFEQVNFPPMQFLQLHQRPRFEVQNREWHSLLETRLVEAEEREFQSQLQLFEQAIRARDFAEQNRVLDLIIARNVTISLSPFVARMVPYLARAAPEVAETIFSLAYALKEDALVLDALRSGPAPLVAYFERFLTKHPNNLDQINRIAELIANVAPHGSNEFIRLLAQAMESPIFAIEAIRAIGSCGKEAAKVIPLLRSISESPMDSKSNSLQRSEVARSSISRIERAMLMAS